MKKIIEEDSIFLYSQGLIDYSLIVIKIDYAKYLEENGNKGIEDQKIYKSTKEPGVAYIFGIIDYL